MDRLRHFHLFRLILLSAVTLCSPFELTIPSNDDENVMCTSMWSFAHMTSSETIFGIPFGRSDWPHSSLPADTKLNCGREEDREREKKWDLMRWLSESTTRFETTLLWWCDDFNEHASSRVSAKRVEWVSTIFLFTNIVLDHRGSVCLSLFVWSFACSRSEN